MDSDQSALYPANYFRDIAFFSAKFMTHRFDQRKLVDLTLEDHYNEYVLQPTGPLNTFHRPLKSLQAEALHDDFTTKFEKQMYNVILDALLSSRFDESVAIGALVLLDILSDIILRKKENSIPFLPSYPNDNYIRVYLGAFMLSYRIISNDKPLAPGFWGDVVGHGWTEESTMMKYEKEFRQILEDNIGKYNMSLVSSDPDFLKLDFKYTGGPANIIPPNPFIMTTRFKQMKATMYPIICILMNGREEETVTFEHGSKWSLLDVSLEFPPCYPHMLRVIAHLEGKRVKHPELSQAGNWEVARALYPPS